MTVGRLLAGSDPSRQTIYEGIPHGTNRAINTDVAEFFRSVMEAKPGEKR